MSLKMPENMEECVYFTRRVVDNGRIVAWVFREQCPKCKGALMGKPVEKGKIKTRAEEYICPKCKYTVPKEEYEDTLTCNIQYTCPACRFEGEIQVPFKRKKFKGADAVVFECAKCKEKIPVTKKMKRLKE
ncbi:MAG: hypothetical protein KJ583_01410 [Nanoarchaeota archaeon]|nr:hypothetical protein [Nanoarchaeota archaeon]MBU1269182.1 hypothetical protein [Nanoarchaeota archaeon]MBU1603950.1 hypothetical protein [Nanoarchaeota archaeon]MBU2442638.1 hypothetical protein [Nanoarchaeota archaeon]